MNGIHDLGGAHGHGPILNDPNEPVFSHDWERRTFSLFASLFVGGHFNVDEFRHAIERMDPAHYLEGSYYEHWLHSFETLLVEKGVITAAELAQGKSDPAAAASNAPVLTQEMVALVVNTGGSARIDEEVAPKFRVGDRVRTKNINPVTHTRLPRYARSKVGTIEIDHGVFVTPDAAAHGLGEKPQHVYSVSFTAKELWGEDASPNDTVRIDLWDEYLEVV
ncbi:Cobalt-containing nitrile hydratase subunit beta [Marinobacterium lacunae]|uniref:Nitrile hydratase subunit beta n=1 Tax=Marinobacterium lacunae TaxID=1232683 RepID=A0A081FWZ2_9GAMM|nr:nitrile hydratase subunit beta [Marinobacterium lacunae]KEA63047.1 Cobalt-containing nitrile hydratase subunit beta [Marinobacterium lacunae]